MPGQPPPVSQSVDGEAITSAPALLKPSRLIQRALVWITKNRLARIAWLPAQSLVPVSTTENPSRFPGGAARRHFCQTIGEPDSVSKIQSERRHRRGSCQSLLGSNGAVSRGTRVQVIAVSGRRKKKREKAPYNHLSRIIRIIYLYTNWLTCIAAPYLLLRPLTSTTEKVHRRVRLPATRLRTSPALPPRRSRQSACDCIRGPAQLDRRWRD